MNFQFKRLVLKLIKKQNSDIKNEYYFLIFQNFYKHDKKAN
jgi:hypothetical protein